MTDAAIHADLRDLEGRPQAAAAATTASRSSEPVSLAPWRRWARAALAAHRAGVPF